MEVKVKSLSGTEYLFSYQQNLIMLHSHTISAQWKLDQVGIEVCHHGECVKVGISATLPTGVPSEYFQNHHQSFYFVPEEFEKLLTFFKILGFPCPTSNPFNH